VLCKELGSKDSSTSIFFFKKTAFFLEDTFVCDFGASLFDKPSGLLFSFSTESSVGTTLDFSCFARFEVFLSLSDERSRLAMLGLFEWQEAVMSYVD
jgi:hypothetical protein